MTAAPSPTKKRAGWNRWKKPSHVRRLTFTLDEKKQPIRVGGEKTGDYYLGRLRFNDGKIHRVVIKQFKKDYLTNRLAAAHFAKAMQKLIRAGVRVPKMGMIKIPTPTHPEGEYVVVAPFFGSREKGSAFEANHVERESPLPIRLKAMEQLTRIANTGLLANLDAVNIHSNHKRGVRVIDLDFTIEHVLFHGESSPLHISPRDSTNEIAVCVRELSNNATEKKLFWSVVETHALPSIRKYIREFREE